MINSRAQTLTYDSGGKLQQVTGAGGRGNKLTRVFAPVTAPNCTGSQYRSPVLNSGGGLSSSRPTARGASRPSALSRAGPAAPSTRSRPPMWRWSPAPTIRGAGWRATVDGRTTTYAYWQDNKLLTKTADDAKLNGDTSTRDVVLEEDEWDAAGNMIVQVTGGGQTTTEFDYDPAGRLAARILPGPWPAAIPILAIHRGCLIPEEHQSLTSPELHS